MIKSIADVPFRTVELSDKRYENEGLRFVTVKSPALGRRADCTVWSPATNFQEIDTVLILLHGVYGSAWSWPLKTGVHRTAARLLRSGEIRPLVIAMPSDGLLGDGSGYLTHPSLDVERWIVEEVPALARLAVPALRADARIGISGLSMGGYGALRLGAKYADSFASISAHSAITEIAQMLSFVEEPLQGFTSTAPAEELSVMHWLLKARAKLPPLRFDCGVADSLLEGNRALHCALKTAGIAHVYEQFTGGHDWSYWTEHVPATLLHAAPA